MSILASFHFLFADSECASDPSTATSGPINLAVLRLPLPPPIRHLFVFQTVTIERQKPLLTFRKLRMGLDRCWRPVKCLFTFQKLEMILQGTTGMLLHDPFGHFEESFATDDVPIRDPWRWA